MVRSNTRSAAKGVAEVACHGPRRAVANRVGDAAEGGAEVATADIIAQAVSVATRAAGIALSGYTSLSGIAIADAFPGRFADAAAGLQITGKITGAGAAIEVAGTFRWLDAHPADATRTGAADRAAPAAMPIVGLGVHALAATADLATGAASAPLALAPHATLAPGAVVAAAPAVLAVALGIDALPATRGLTARAAASPLALAASTGLTVPAAVATATAVGHVVPGVDAGLPTADRPVLALLLFLFLGRELDGVLSPRPAEAKRGEHQPDAAAGQRLPDVLCQLVESRSIHGVSPPRIGAYHPRRRRGTVAAARPPGQTRDQ